MSITHYINGNTPKCRDCKYYVPLFKKRAPDNDGTCTNKMHIKANRRGKNVDAPYYCSGFAGACFDAEEKDEEQTTLF